MGNYMNNSAQSYSDKKGSEIEERYLPSSNKKHNMSNHSLTNQPSLDEEEEYFSTNPSEKIENYMGYPSESYSIKQDSKTEEQNVPSYDKHKMSNHSLIPPSSPDKKENNILQQEKITMNKIYTPNKTINWYSEEKSQENIPDTKDHTETTQSETEIYRDVQNSNNNLKNIAIHYKEQESTLSDNPQTSSQCKSFTRTKEIEDLYLTQNVKTCQTHNSQEMQDAQKEKNDIDKCCQNYRLKNLLLDLHSRDKAKKGQNSNCTNASSSTDTSNTQEKRKESNTLHETGTFSFLPKDIINSEKIQQKIHDENLSLIHISEPTRPY